MLGGMEGNNWGSDEDPNLRRRNLREKNFVPIEEVPDPTLNPEEALVATNGVQKMNGHKIHSVPSQIRLEDVPVDTHADEKLAEYHDAQIKYGSKMFERNLETNNDRTPSGSILSQQGNLGGSSGASAEYKARAVKEFMYRSNIGISHGRHGRMPEHEKGGETIRDPEKIRDIGGTRSSNPKRFSRFLRRLGL